ncbi:MAG: gamma-glutamyltransferase [Proteobacteria bacterium]|nr:gamma-glutamyltransferase [Pseudomonadota bacterium]
MRGVVASGHPRVSEAAAEVMRAGGNAFDAVVAAGFASAVVEPALTSLGGGGFLLARTARGRARLFDFFVDSPGRDLAEPGLEPHFVPVTVRFPASEQVFNAGLGSVAVPGNLRGFLHVHERLGRAPLREVLAPAIEFAARGVPVSHHQAYFLGLLAPIMTLTEAGRALFTRDGRLVGEGDTLTNPDLASFLECLAVDGDEGGLYAGALAGRIAADMRDGRGLLGESDLAAFRVIEREPLEVAYRGLRLLTNPPPSFGGSLLALSLTLLERRDLSAEAMGGRGHALALLEVMEEVDRRRQSGRVPRFQRGTTHVSACDPEGNVASMTTSNGEGSGYVVPGTGIMLNNMLGEEDLHPEGFHAGPPGQRVASMISPSLLLRGDDVRLVLGSGGSKRIRTALLQVLSAVSDFGLAIGDAVEHPRLHWDGEQVQAEPGWSEAVLAALRERRRLNEWACKDVYFGGVHGVRPGPDGEGAGDSRRGGAAATLEDG